MEYVPTIEILIKIVIGLAVCVCVCVTQVMHSENILLKSLYKEVSF